MGNGKDMIELVKRTALAAVEAAQPVKALFGTVIESSPVKISIEQKLVITETQLVRVGNHYNYRVGTKLILLRVQGGQQYLVLGSAGVEE